MGRSPWGRKESDTTERLHFPFSFSCIGEGNGNLLGAGERHSTRDKGHEEGGSAYAKAGSRLGSPPDILEHLPPKKPESAYFIALCIIGD